MLHLAHTNSLFDIWFQEADYAFYQHLVDVLLPDVSLKLIYVFKNLI
jgi:hypothetical protein